VSGLPSRLVQTSLLHRVFRSTPTFAAEFYDQVADLIPGYVTSAGRGDFNAQIELPSAAGNGKVVLAAEGVDFQDAVDPSKYRCTHSHRLGETKACLVEVGQYWGNITSDGLISIPRVKAGTYRLTMYADGVFGQFEQDGVVVSAGDGQGSPLALTWNGEAHGKELWRIGTPDKVGRNVSLSKGTGCADVSLNLYPDRGRV
jgi:rhamnogalacturonan endolyase